MSIKESDNKRELIGKLTAARTALLLKLPFYGTLLMHLKFGLANCGTACTDMKRILWDPGFLDRISIEEVQFVMLHEVMHCVLNHINRGKGKISILYNVAADIVVNSNILQAYGIEEFMVDGEPAMHLAPDGVEGYRYSADQVYKMLLERYENSVDDWDKLCAQIDSEYGSDVDNHEIWEAVPLAPEVSEEWKGIVREIAQKSGSKDKVPSMLRELLDSDDYKPVIDWRRMLNDFIKLVAYTYDFTFIPSDRRFSEGDFIFPAFHELEGERVENLWVLVDTSGSVDAWALTALFQELKSAIEQFSSLYAKFSCFDTQVTEPVEFKSVDDLRNVKLSGGGGTNFRSIFNYLKEFMMDDLPVAIVIMTDGYAFYPAEAEALGVPVLWVLINNKKDAPWGKSIHINSEIWEEEELPF